MSSKDEIITGIILCGGKSSRMGMDKGMVIYKGKPMIEYVIDLLQPFCSEIIISANSDVYNQLGFQVVHDTYKEIGPLGGIISTLEVSNTKWNMVLSCDMPHLTAGLIHALISACQENYECIVPNYNSKIEPLGSLYSTSCLSKLKESADNNKYKLQSIIRGLNTSFVNVDELILRHSNMFLNINTQSDL